MRVLAESSSPPSSTVSSASTIAMEPLPNVPDQLTPREIGCNAINNILYFVTSCLRNQYFLKICVPLIIWCSLAHIGLHIGSQIPTCDNVGNIVINMTCANHTLPIANVSNEYNLTTALPLHIIPEEYILDIKINLTDIFSANLNIFLLVTEETKILSLHSVNLNITNYDVARHIINLESAFLNILKIKRQYQLEQWYVVELLEPLEPGFMYALNIEYHGKIDHKNRGFLKIPHVEHSNTDEYTIITKFKDGNARYVFPCFDDEYYKSKFVLRISTPAEMTSIGMTQLQLYAHHDPEFPMLERNTFERSIAMTSSNVAFCVSTDLQFYVDDQVNIWVREQHENHVDRLVSLVMEVVEAFDQLYYLEEITRMKMSLVFIPNYPYIEGTTQTQMIILSESLLHKDDERLVEKQIINAYGTYLFGTVVTAKESKDEWLIEGLAKFFIYRLQAERHHHTLLFEYVIVPEIFNSLESDGLNNTRRMNPNHNAFNKYFITGSKGMALISMMCHNFGVNLFGDAYLQFILLHYDKTITTSDFWLLVQVLDTRNNQVTNNTLTSVTLPDIMIDWENNTGYPLVNVSINYENQTAVVTQSEFVYKTYTNVTKSEKNPKLWWIPFNYVEKMRNSLDMTARTMWIHNNTQPHYIRFREFYNDDWIVGNMEATGYYRVNYDDKTWSNIINFLRDSEDWTEIEAINRAQLIDDAFNLAKAGYINYTIPLNLSLYLYREYTPLPWDRVLKHVLRLSEVFEIDENHCNFLNYRKKLHMLLLKNVPLHYMNLLPNRNLRYIRNSLDSPKCVVEDGLTCHQVSFYIISDIQNFFKLSHDQQIKNACFHGRQFGNITNLPVYMKRFTYAKTSVHTEILIKCLSCSQDKNVIKILLEYAIGAKTIHGVYFNSTLRRQTVRELSNKKFTKPMVLEYFSDHLHELRESSRHGEVLEAVNSFLRNLSDNDLFERFQDLIKLELKEHMNLFASGIEQAKNRIGWYKEHRDDIFNWVKLHHPTC